MSAAVRIRLIVIAWAIYVIPATPITFVMDHLLHLALWQSVVALMPVWWWTERWVARRFR